MTSAPTLLNPREKKLPCCEHCVWQRVKNIVLSDFQSKSRGKLEKGCFCFKLSLSVSQPAQDPFF